MRTEIKVALVGFLGIVAGAGIPILFDHLSHKPRTILLDAAPYSVSYGFSTLCALDLKLVNLGGIMSYVTRLRLNVLDGETYDYDPCPTCQRQAASAVYNIATTELRPGRSIEVSVSHTIPAGESERIILLLGGGSKCFHGRLTVGIIADGSHELTSQPIEVVILNHDRSAEVPIGSQKVTEFLNEHPLYILDKEKIQELLDLRWDPEGRVRKRVDEMRRIEEEERRRAQEEYERKLQRRIDSQR